MQVYDLKVVKYFMTAALIWAAVGMAVGVLIAGQLYWPALNLDYSWTHFGRLRPLHTNAVIFGSVGSLVMGASLYVVQRTGRTNLFNRPMSWMVFWMWQLVIVLAALTLPFGFTTSKEFAELEWPIDILIALTWVLYGILFIGTLAKRKDKHIFVSNWFFASCILVIAIIFVVNNLALPVSLMKSYSIYAGGVDGLIQWWWGHNAVGFLLSAAIIGMNYYFIAKVAERPIYSYRLSIIHFWGLVGMYTWAGTHHLIFSSVPDWIQSLGIILSLILWLPSWLGAWNSYMTLRQNPEKLKTDYLMKFFKWAIIYYALATFEGPLLAIRFFNLIAHNTDWIVGHVHSGALGWVGFVLIATLYYLIPKLSGDKPIWSQKLLKYHYYLGHVGVFLYMISMWVAGIGQGLMMLSMEDDGSMTYNFIDTIRFSYPWWLIRFIGGALYVAGILIMAYNLYKTVKQPSLGRSLKGETAYV